MASIQDTIITSQDSETILCSDYTPEKAYDIITGAVYSARQQPDYIHINIEEIPPNTEIGKVKYQTNLDKIIELHIYDSILEEYGVEK